MENFLFQEQGIEIFLFQPVKGQPLKFMGVVPLQQGELLAFGQQICMGNVHQEVQAQLVVVKAVYVLREKCLIQP